MERLTKQETIVYGGVEYVICEHTDEECNDWCMYKKCKWNEKALKRLKEYEDAEEKGLLLRLPCKVGDVVWHEKKYATYLIGAHPYQITNVMISQNKKGEWTKKYRAMLIHNGKTIDCQVNFSFDDIGKTVFLTREEAEQALAKMKEV